MSFSGQPDQREQPTAEMAQLHNQLVNAPQVNCEEDDGDNEDDTRNDADPGGYRGEPTSALRLGIGGRRCGGRRRVGGDHGAGRRFGRRRCFAHEFEDAFDGYALVLN